MGTSKEWFYAYSQKNTVSMVVTEWGQIPVGAGLAFADKYFETGGVTMTYFELHVKVHYMKLQHGNAVEITSILLLKTTATQWERLLSVRKPY
jgi:hypothetical protein